MLKSVKFCGDCGTAVLKAQTAEIISDQLSSPHLQGSEGVVMTGINSGNSNSGSSDYVFEEQPQYAGFWLRLYALVTDVLIVGVTGIILHAIFQDELPNQISLNGQHAANLFCKRFDGTVKCTSRHVLPLILIIVGFLYCTILNYKYGQTLGKRMVGIKIATKNQYKNLSYKQCVYRFLYSIIFIHFGYFFQPFNKDKQALHDRSVGSVVIVSDPEAFEKNTNIVIKIKFLIAIPCFYLITYIPIFSLFGMK